MHISLGGLLVKGWPWVMLVVCSGACSGADDSQLGALEGDSGTLVNDSGPSDASAIPEGGDEASLDAPSTPEGGDFDAALTDAGVPEGSTLLDASFEAGTPEAGVPDAATPDGGPREPSAACRALITGWNSGFVVDGLPRSFYLDLPVGVGTGGPWPVVFSWHGMGDPPEPMRALLRDEIDGPRYRFILVTPDDLNLSPPLGADWDNLELRDGSIEARLFDEVISCLDARFGVDPDRIHSIGFSSGAIVSNMLGVVRGDRIASLVTFSGAYWSNPKNTNPLAAWPALATTNPYVQLLMYGGGTDIAFGANFTFYAGTDIPYLNAAGHDVIGCDHGGGHALPSGFGGDKIAAFLAAHPRGIGASPYAAGLPAGYPSLCWYFAGG